MSTTLTEDNLNRLAIGIIEKNKCSYGEALKILASLKLYIYCGEGIRQSSSLQAALLTIVNTGGRAFLGGVYVAMPDDVSLSIPWPFSKTLNSAVNELGARIIRAEEIGTNFAIYIATPASIDNNSIEVVCNGWIGGISNGIDRVLLNNDVDFALGGILAGAIAVSAVFMRQTNISPSACDASTGVSLWRPDLDWTSAQANGPILQYLPKKAWLLGLGHLGQAYCWTMSLLPYSPGANVKFLLQDFDKVSEGNFSAGLLTTADSLNISKARHVAKWFEQYGFETTITERRYDEKTVRTDDEPYLALCGFDNAKSRLTLEKSGFDLIIESAIGTNIFDFDSIITHIFPNGNKKPADIWENESKNVPNETVIAAMQKEVKKEECGVLVANLASKAMSASFVGATASTFVIGEVLRALHGGAKYETIMLRMRSIKNIRTSPLGNYSFELGKNGFIDSNLVEKVLQ